MAETAVTVKDIASHAAVSMGTVSRVFNNHKSVTEETRQRVLRVAAELGYAGLNGQAYPMRANSRAVREIGFLFHAQSEGEKPATADPFWSHVLHGVESEAAKTAVKVTYRAITNLVEMPSALVSAVHEMRLDGVVLVGPADPSVAQLLLNAKLPLVVVGAYEPGLKADAVSCDNFDGGRQAAQGLLAAGHRQIAFIGGTTTPGTPGLRPYSVEQRAAGFRSALFNAGITPEHKLFEPSNRSPEGGYEACKRLLERRAKFSAVACANDLVAIGVLKALREAGLSVPDDVSVVGFEDVDMAEHLTPPLSSVRIDKEGIGSAAVKILTRRVVEPQAPPSITLLGVELVQRSSVAPLKA
jgi:DNA-binding LacI/PurR family transcriptional regulator